MRIFHLSHIDLDGYSCQLVSKFFCNDIRFFNSNYGNEVTARLKEIEDEIKHCDTKEEILILVTDINITREECTFLDQTVARMRFLNYKIEIQLLDHHQTGAPQAKEYGWYHLDNSKCATLLTYEYFTKRFPKVTLPEQLKAYVDAVNAFDLWKENEPFFEFGKVLNRYLVEAKEVNKMLFREDNVAYRVKLLESTFDYLDGNRYIELDDDLIRHKKAALGEGKSDTLDNLTSTYITGLLTKRKEDMVLYYGEHKGILTSQIGNTSVLGNSFLKNNPEFHFFMDVAPSGNVSLRADNQMDVSEMAVSLFGGGGHANASGGRMGNLRDFYAYKELKTHVQGYIDEKSK